MKPRDLWLVAVVLVIGLGLVREGRRGAFDPIDAAWGAWMRGHARERGDGPDARPALTLIAIDEESVGEGRPWPWAPIEHALTLRALLAHRPAAVCFEPVLAWDDPAPDYLESLVGYCLRTPKLLLGWEVTQGAGAPLDVRRSIGRVSGDLSLVPSVGGVARAPCEELGHASFQGFLLAPAPGDRAVSRVPLLLRHGEAVLPSFALQAALLWLRLTPDDVSGVIGSHLALGDVRRVPIDAAGAMGIESRAPAVYDVISRADLLAESERRERGRPGALDLETLRDRIALVGRTDPASRLSSGDDAGAVVAPVESLARAIADMQRGFSVTRAPAWVELAIVGVLALLAPILSRRGLGAALGWTLLAFGGFILLSLGLYEARGFRMSPVPVVAVVGFPWIARLFPGRPAEDSRETAGPASRREPVSSRNRRGRRRRR